MRPPLFPVSHAAVPVPPHELLQTDFSGDHPQQGWQLQHPAIPEEEAEIARWAAELQKLEAASTPPDLALHEDRLGPGICLNREDDDDPRHHEKKQEGASHRFEKTDHGFHLLPILQKSG